MLGYSRLIWARFVQPQDLQTVLRCHMAGFASLGGVPDYPYVVVPHPLGSKSMEQLRDLAATAAPDVLSILIAQR